MSYNPTNTMETFLRCYFKFFYYIFSVRYKLEWEPGLKVTLKLDKSFHRILWLGRLFIKCLYAVICWAFFLYLLPKYLKEKRYDCIAFHSEWGMVSLVALVHQLPHLTASDEIIQLSGSIQNLITRLERGETFRLFKM